MNSGFSVLLLPFDPFFISAYHARVNVPTYPPNSWATSQLRESIAPLPHLFIPVDYTDPIAVRTIPGRGHKLQKAYIALFVCLTTKALYLELVSDYTSSVFIAAYQRFVSRQGLSTSMYSDNGTLHGIVNCPMSMRSNSRSQLPQPTELALPTPCIAALRRSMRGRH